ncbi:MAG TPA: glycosyltransferase family 2 protein [Vicinamibacterales bacterium]|nr:glycosyltransferase family 2 protein [Vicinamibacterales bacterium]
MKLTVTVITRNEAANIQAALESVSWADEIIVVDSRSTDATVEIARRYATRVEVHDWGGYSAQKNYAASLAANDWILSIDADERVTPELAREIRELMERGPTASGYRISRVTWYLGRWMYSTDWYPDYQLRLYDRRSGKWNARRVHESVELRDRPGVLKHQIQHYAYRDVSDHVTSIDHYTTLIAEQWLEEGRRTSLLAAIAHPPAAFLRNYVLRRGFRDGAAGFIVSALNAYYVFMKLVKLWELQHGVSRSREGRRSAADRGHWRKPIHERGPNADRRAESPRAGRL